jgi:hypothetical protein
MTAATPRIALLFSGQPRSIKQSYPAFKKHVIDQNISVDVFAFFWWDASKIGEYQTDHAIRSVDPRKWSKWEADAIESFIGLYSPVKMNTEKEFAFDSMDHDIYNTPFARETVSMYNSYFMVNQMKQLHEKNHGFKYDWVIRSRPDFRLNKDIPLDQLDNEKLYVVEAGIPTDGNRAIDCNFAFSNSENMDVYCNLFNNIEEYILNDCAGPVVGEPLLFHHLYKNGFESPKIINTSLPSPSARATNKKHLGPGHRAHKIPIAIDHGFLKYGPSGSQKGTGDCWIIRTLDSEV